MQPLVTHSQRCSFSECQNCLHIRYLSFILEYRFMIEITRYKEVHAT